MKKKTPLANVTVARMQLARLFCVTIDHQTKEDGTVTIRFRDSMKQERINIKAVKELVEKAIL